MQDGRCQADVRCKVSGVRCKNRVLLLRGGQRAFGRPARPHRRLPLGPSAAQRLVPSVWRRQEPGEPAPRRPGQQGSELWHHQDGVMTTRRYLRLSLLEHSLAHLLLSWEEARPHATEARLQLRPVKAAAARHGGHDVRRPPHGMVRWRQQPWSWSRLDTTMDTTMDSTIATCAPFLVAHGLLLLHPLDLQAQLPLLPSEQRG